MITLTACKNILQKAGSTIEPAMLYAFIKVETGGAGFFSDGRLKIAFEPHIFRKKTGLIVENGIDVPSKEWKAFSTAFNLNPNAAMESTSIGLPQIMGYHYKILGYKTVGAMWDDFKAGEENQVLALIRFIEYDLKLKRAMLSKNYEAIANIYNGPDWALIAAKTGRKPYPEAIKEEYLANVGK